MTTVFIKPAVLSSQTECQNAKVQEAKCGIAVKHERARQSLHAQNTKKGP